MLSASGSADTTDSSAATKKAVLALADWIPGWIELRRRMLRVPGVQLSIRIGGELVLNVALGTADDERDVPLTTDHLFRIASHSKTFAATACLILTERGQLRLDDTVGQWLPELADTELAGLTVRALLGHQGGVIRDGVDSDYWQLISDFPDEDFLVGALHTKGSTFGSDEHFKYSNYGFSIIGMIVARVSGMSFNDFVRTEILDKLDLPRVHPDVDGIDATELAAGHSLRLDGEDEQFVMGNPSTGAMSAATGFVACAHDLTVYASAHLPGDDRLVSDAGKRLMQRTESIVEVRGEEKGRYGLGLELHTVGKRKMFGHSGGFPGFVTRTFVDPADRLAISVLTNQSGGPAHELAVGILSMIDLAVSGRSAGAEGHPFRTTSTRPRSPRGWSRASATWTSSTSAAGWCSCTPECLIPPPKPRTWKSLTRTPCESCRRPDMPSLEKRSPSNGIRTARSVPWWPAGCGHGRKMLSLPGAGPRWAGARQILCRSWTLPKAADLPVHVEAFIAAISENSHARLQGRTVGGGVVALVGEPGSQPSLAR